MLICNSIKTDLKMLIIGLACLFRLVKENKIILNRIAAAGGKRREAAKIQYYFSGFTI